MTSPFFIVGTQRSGTTLLRLILNSHSKIAVPEEGTFLMPLLKEKYLNYTFKGKELDRLIKYISQNPQFELWNKDFTEFFREVRNKGRTTLKEFISGLYSFYAKKEGKIFWGDKTPSFFRKIDVLKKLFPEAKFIHIVRDGRDIFNSWRKMDPTKNNAPVIALDWIYKIKKIEKSFQKMNPKDNLTIRYEDLLDDPKKTVSSIGKFLEIDFEETMLEFYKQSGKYIGKHHSPLIYKSITNVNKFKWKKTLTKNEIGSFALVAKKYLKKYGYELPDKCVDFQVVLYTIANLAYGFPYRTYQVLKAKFAYELALKKGKRVRGIKFGEKPNM